MNYSQPGAIEKYRENTLSRGAPVSLVPKRCSCGKATTAKQLTQYGRCNKCLTTKNKTCAVTAAQVSNHANK